jgi:hypothetical protein
VGDARQAQRRVMSRSRHQTGHQFA